MKTEIFNFHIPDELIAQYPAKNRSDSRLLVYNRSNNEIIDSFFINIADFLTDEHFLVLNNSKVIPARLNIIKKNTGQKGEILILKIIDKYNAEILTDRSKKYRENTEIILPDDTVIKIEKNLDEQIKHAVSNKPVFNINYLKKYAHVPLPPYIRHAKDEVIDKQRYQTIYSKAYGSSAAPTAGLHFDDKIFKSLKDKEIDFCYISLHVGLGTFQPIYSKNIEEHKIHEEIYNIDDENALKINNAIKKKLKIIPVGTTSLRTIETAFFKDQIKSGTGSTSLYIYPSYKFKITSGLITNFHTPKSSLLVLVSALIGYEKLKEIYDYAIKKKYRFFSYGDAMLIL
ncbi:MAG: tRNA preQ1(34) S-adenosylmethionine ribosyltransferase-isomerase QueA [Spirochaetes bacterium]|nr:tRNA preQ1(34) S-adenosylmethionine ribosyltransferase-isomerase QueA [Spirochaetota bacterium]